MSADRDRVKHQAELIESLRRERGVTQQALASGAGYNSTQALSNKLRGSGGFSVLEVVRLAGVLNADPLAILFEAWPELAAADPLSELRDVLTEATDAQLREVTELARRVVGPQSGSAGKRGTA